MFDDPATSDIDPEFALGAAPAAARALAERQVRMLDRLAQAGLDLALAVQAQASAAAAAGEPISPDAAMSFSRIARTVRLTLALQAKLAEQIVELEDSARDRGAQAADARKARVGRIVRRVIRAEHHDRSTNERLAGDVRERLEDDDIYGDLQTRSVGEIIALICKDLGLTPDWAALADEAWAREEIESLAPASAFAVRATPRAQARPPWLDPQAASP